MVKNYDREMEAGDKVRLRQAPLTLWVVRSRDWSQKHISGNWMIRNALLT